MNRFWFWVLAVAVTLTACSGKKYSVSPTAPLGPGFTDTPTPSATPTTPLVLTDTPTASETPTNLVASTSTFTPTPTMILTATPSFTSTVTSPYPDWNLSNAVTTLTTGTYNFNCVHLTSGAVVNINGGVTIFCQCFTLDAGATITGMGRGVSPFSAAGTAYDHPNGYQLAAGGGHGGPGGGDCSPSTVLGPLVCVTGGGAYDDPVHPTQCGQNGGQMDYNLYLPCTQGGALLKLVVMNQALNQLAPATLNGVIDMGGHYGCFEYMGHNGGGAGGAILFETSALAGNGALKADGGNSGGGDGDGGGGIISLIADTTAFTGTTSAVAPFTSSGAGNGIVTVTVPPLSGY